MTEKKQKKSILPKLTVFIIGILYIIGPLIQMNTLIVKKDWYFDIYSYLGWLTPVRYMFSWFQRIVGITTAIGLMFFKEIFRKILLLICLFTIVTVYWKHHYPAFLAHVKIQAQNFEVVRQSGLDYKTLAIISIIVHSFLNIAFCLIVIFCLTRPSVKKLFIKKP